MAHFTDRLPEEVELGAVKRTAYGTSVVDTDGGWEHRNNRWRNPKRTYELSFPPSLRDDAVYLAVIALFEKCEGSLHSFDLVDWTDESGNTVVPVRFDGDLEVSGIASHLDKFGSIPLIEVFL